MKGFLIFIALLGLSSAVPVRTRTGAGSGTPGPASTNSSPLSSAPPSPPPAGNVPPPPTNAVQQGIGGKQVVDKNPPNAAPADIAVSQHQAIDAATAPSKNPLTSTAVVPPQPGVPNGMAVTAEKPTASTDKKQQEVSQQFKDASAQSAPQLNDVIKQREDNNNIPTEAKPKVDPRKPVSMIHTEDATTLATKQNLPPGQQIPGDNSGSVIGKTGSWGKGGASFVPNCGTSGTGQQKIDPSCAQVTQGNQAAGNEQINWQTPGQVPQGSKDALDQYNQQKKQG